MQTPTPKKESPTKPAPTAETKAKPGPAITAREAQVASVFDSCIPGGGLYTYPVQTPPAR
jgi:hypothetical protein